MALRGTLTHRKNRRLAMKLGIDPCFSLGIVESLWDVTARQAQNGDIGKMSNEDIAMEMFYSGDPDALVEALIYAGFVDNSEEHRLLIHDWHIHSDDATDNRIARSGKRYANGAQPRMRKLTSVERARLCAQHGYDVHTTCARESTQEHDGALPVTSNQKPVFKKPSRDKREPDPRHTPFKEILAEAWKAKNPSTEMPWSAAEAKQLALLLSSVPSLTADTFRQLLRNRHKSEVNHAERPQKWLHSLLDYGNGPLDRFGKPLHQPPSKVQPLQAPLNALEEIRERNRLAAEEVERERKQAS